VKAPGSKGVTLGTKSTLMRTILMIAVQHGVKSIIGKPWNFGFAESSVVK